MHGIICRHDEYDAKSETHGYLDSSLGTMTTMMQNQEPLKRCFICLDQEYDDV